MLYLHLPVVEVQDVSRDLPHGCELTFPDPDELHIMTLSVRPPTGYWANGIFLFQIEIPPEYNMLVRRRSRALVTWWHWFWRQGCSS